jgi:hypothetical protein
VSVAGDLVLFAERVLSQSEQLREALGQKMQAALEAAACDKSDVEVQLLRCVQLVSSHPQFEFY